MEDEGRVGERRREKRHDGKIYDVMFQVLGAAPSAAPADYHVGRTVDLSRSGMRFETETPLEAGNRIQYFVHSPSGKSGREGTADVVRVESAGGKWFAVAVRFRATPADAQGETR